VKIREREKENTTEREIDNFRDSRYFVCWSISEGLTRERRREKENKREGERELSETIVVFFAGRFSRG